MRRSGPSGLEETCSEWHEEYIRIDDRVASITRGSAYIVIASGSSMTTLSRTTRSGVMKATDGLSRALATRSLTKQ